MKKCEELKAEIEQLEAQMIDENRPGRMELLKILHKKFGFTAGMVKGTLAGGSKKR